MPRTMIDGWEQALRVVLIEKDARAKSVFDELDAERLAHAATAEQRDALLISWGKYFTAQEALDAARATLAEKCPDRTEDKPND